MCVCAVTLLLISITLCADIAEGDNLQIGTSVNSELAHSETVSLSAIPLTTRTKNVFYSDETNRILKGISALDMDNSTCRGAVTSGGVGFSFANVRLKSDRGYGIHYQVQFFV